jgi:hypothetical protein
MQMMNQEGSPGSRKLSLGTSVDEALHGLGHWHWK